MVNLMSTENADYSKKMLEALLCDENFIELLNVKLDEFRSKNAGKLFEYGKKLVRLSDMVIVPSGNSGDFTEKVLYEFLRKVEEEFRESDSLTRAKLKYVKEAYLELSERIIKKFNNGENFVQIKNNIRGKDAHIFKIFGYKTVNDDLTDLKLTNDAINRAGARSITNYLPFIPYQRQDKKDDGRVPISAKLVFDEIYNSCGGKLERIVTCDLHSAQAQGYLNIPVDNVSAIPLFAAYYKAKFKDFFSNPDKVRDLLIVVSPDAGGGKRAKYLADLLGVNYVVLSKSRQKHGESKTEYHLRMDVKGKDIIVVDDIVDTGGSVIEPAEYLYSRGAESVNVCCTHGIFSEKEGEYAERKLYESKINVITTNSFAEKHRGYWKGCGKWLTTISIAPFFATLMYCNQMGASVSRVMEHQEKIIRENHNAIELDGNIPYVIDIKQE